MVIRFSGKTLFLSSILLLLTLHQQGIDHPYLFRVGSGATNAPRTFLWLSTYKPYDTSAYTRRLRRKQISLRVPSRPPQNARKQGGLLSGEGQLEADPSDEDEPNLQSPKSPNSQFSNQSSRPLTAEPTPATTEPDLLERRMPLDAPNQDKPNDPLSLFDRRMPTDALNQDPIWPSVSGCHRG